MPDVPTSSRSSRSLFAKEVFKDKPLAILLAAGVMLTVAIIIRVLVSVKQYDVDIPVRYTQFGSEPSFINGDWYTHYELMFFAILILALNGFLALRLYRSDRWLSLLISMTQVIILMLLLIIAAALLSTSAVAG
jgi:hypothetical protein